MNRRGRHWGVVFYVAAAALAALAISYQARSPVVKQRQELAAREARLRAEVRALWLRGVHLERIRDAVKSDPIMIERIARGRLGYARVGEIVHDAAPDSVPLFLEAQRKETPSASLDWLAIARESILPSLFLLGVGLLLAAFFANMSLEPKPVTDTGVFRV